MGGATSDVQSWINLALILVIRTATGKWWEDEEELEKQISYYIRRTPLGLGAGTLFDIGSLIAFHSDEIIRSKKIQALLGMFVPPQVPYPMLEKPAKALSEQFD